MEIAAVYGVTMRPQVRYSAIGVMSARDTINHGNRGSGDVPVGEFIGTFTTPVCTDHLGPLILPALEPIARRYCSIVVLIVVQIDTRAR